MKITILTTFPEMFAPLHLSMLGRAEKAGLLDIKEVDIRIVHTDEFDVFGYSWFHSFNVFKFRVQISYFFENHTKLYL